MEFPNLSESTPPVKDATTPNPTPHTNDLKREHESVDDFEHLEISPSKEKSNSLMSDPLLNLGTDKDLPAPNVCSQPNFLDQSNNFHPFSQPAEATSKDFFPGMNENSMFSSKTEPLNDFLKDLTSEKNSASVGSEVSKFLEAETGIFKKPETADHSDLSKFSVDNTTISGVKDASKKDSQPDFGNFKHDEALDHDFLSEPSYEANPNKQIIDVTPDKSPSKSVTPEPPAKSVTPEPPAKSVTPEPPAHFNPIVKEEPKPDPFESMTEKFTASEPEPKVPSVPVSQPKPDPIVKDVPVSTILGGVSKSTSDSIKPTPDKKTDSTADFVTKEKTPVKVPEQPSRNISDDDSELIQVDEVFRRIGLAVVFDPWSSKTPTNRMWRRDSWFKPETLHPQVEALVYWRDPKKSGVVFGTILVALLSLTYYSFISVVAYFSLIILCGTISFKVYKSILQAVQKTSDGHPFKEILELELTLPQEKVRALTDVGVAHFNAAVVELRRLFLVEDLVDSIKFAVLLWLLTRVGAWFNGMTLIIIAFIALFSVPKIYENNKAQVDANLAIVQSKLQEITAKIKAALPIGKKEAEKDKEQ